jgi:hypothetical protein
MDSTASRLERLRHRCDAALTERRASAGIAVRKFKRAAAISRMLMTLVALQTLR